MKARKENRTSRGGSPRRGFRAGSVAAVFLAVVWLAVETPPGNAESRPQPIKAELVSSVSSIKPGETFLVGILFHIAPGWHLYWKHPGPAGLPTKVMISAPPGYKLQALDYPIPTSFTQPGNVPGYGYEGELLLFQVIEPPLQLEYGQTASFEASARWLGCNQICVPGQAALKLEIPISDRSRAAREELFQAWSSRLPQREFAPQVVRLPSSGQRHSFAFEWATNVTNPTFFPDPDPGMRVTNITVEPNGTSWKVSFEVSGGSKGAGQLRALISFAEAHGRPMAGEVSLPLS